MTPTIPVGARARFVQSTDAVISIGNNDGGHAQAPTIPQRNTFPVELFDTSGFFVAPQAGFYRFNTAAEIQAGGMLDVILRDDARGQQYFGRGTNSGDVTAQLSATLYLEAGNVVQRYLAYYADAPANVYARGDSNFYEIEYLGL